MLPVLFIQDGKLVTAAGTAPDRNQIQTISKIAATEGHEDQEKAAEYLTYLLDMGLIKPPKTESDEGKGEGKGKGETKPPAQ